MIVKKLERLKHKNIINHAMSLKMFSLNCALLISLLNVCSCSNHQSSKTFDCGLFSFEYPSCFKPITIQSAKHMVLKLESEDYILSASYWERDIDDDVSIWDDGIIEEYENFSPDNSQIVGIEKINLFIKNGDCQCLKIKSNIIQNNVSIRLVNYIMINNGYLFVFGFVSSGKYTINSITKETDSFMSGLKFKSPAKKKISFEELQEKILDDIKTLNAQCPIHPDECTTFTQILLSGKTIIIKTIIEDSYEKQIDYNLFKKQMCENYTVSLPKEFIQLIEEYGFRLEYHIYNENNILKKTISITGNEILNYYK